MLLIDIIKTEGEPDIITEIIDKLIKCDIR